MISAKEIKQKAGKKYFDFLKNKITDEPFEKIIIRADKSYNKLSLENFEKELKEIINQSKEKKEFGYNLDFKKVKTKTLGEQDVPVSIYFTGEKDFVKFLGKEKEVNAFKINVEKILSKFPELEEWIRKNIKKIIENQNQWDELLKVCHYFKINPKPNLYVRELPISVHTKFIENNKPVIRDLLNEIILDTVNKDEKDFEKRFNLKYSEPQIRFKILDEEISKKFFSGIDDLAIPLSQFKTLQLPVKRVLVVENKTTLYTTLTLPKMEKTIAVFGCGYGVSNLQGVDWLNNTELLYWGDIDVQGFEILSQFRGYFDSVKSLFMDSETFKKFYDNDTGTPTKSFGKLNLTTEEQAVYDDVKKYNKRLEQEKIPHDYVKKYCAEKA